MVCNENSGQHAGMKLQYKKRKMEFVCLRDDHEMVVMIVVISSNSHFSLHFLSFSFVRELE
jgi:hypothetical protein